MKICFFAPAKSVHTHKWCRWFKERGHEVHVISFDDDLIDGVYVHSLGTGVNTEGSDLQKLLYLLNGRKLRKTLDEISPDIISVHYASSYGATAALAGVKGYFLSVWGSDIYKFPRKSVLHRSLLKYSLKRAEHLLSTSKAMAEEAKKYINRDFLITPFGVDTQLFSPDKRTRNDGKFVIGTVKGLDPKYGIEFLLKAAALFSKKHPEVPLEIRIAGKGPYETEYKALAESLGIAEITTWLGFIPQEQVAEEWANMDAAVVFSVSESFGVSALEAQASGVPVIISDVPGLMEATNPGVSSLVVKKRDAQALADAVYTLYTDSEKRKTMGISGREFVREHYTLDGCFMNIEKIFMEYGCYEKT